MTLLVFPLEANTKYLVLYARRQESYRFPRLATSLGPGNDFLAVVHTISFLHNRTKIDYLYDECFFQHFVLQYINNSWITIVY